MCIRTCQNKAQARSLCVFLICQLLQVPVAGNESTAEHRAELYISVYLQNGKARPNIISVNENAS